MKNYRHRLITFTRIIKSGIQNFFRNATLAIAATAVMIITLTILLLSFIANITFTNTIQQLHDRITISVYLKDNVTPEQRDKLVSDIKKIDNVREVSFLSKEQALEAYKEQTKGNINLLLAISQTDNPLPATIRVKPYDPSKLQDLKNFIDSPDVTKLQSDKSSYSGETQIAVDKISRATKFLRQAGIVSVAIFATVSILIIFNTIRMAIFNRREELNIMRLLGASTSFIRGPFIVETIIYGFVAAIVSVALCNSLFVVLSSAFEANSLGLLDITYASKYFAANFWRILAIQIAIGIMIGSASSLVATRKYLKFKTPK